MDACLDDILLLEQYHQYYQEEDDYLEKMQLLMYDMLYGEMEVY